MQYKKSPQIPWLFLTFKGYAHERGAWVNDVDLNYLSGLLLHIPSDERKSIAKRYVDVWLKIMNETDGLDLHKKGCARRGANNWIRDEVTKNQASINYRF